MTDQRSESQISLNEATPNGPAWAALVAAGIGGAAFGLLTDVSECSDRTAKILNWYNPSGPLSGVAISAIVIWVVGWALLHARWGKRQLASQVVPMALTILLVLAAIVTTFPPFYELLPKSH